MKYILTIDTKKKEISVNLDRPIFLRSGDESLSCASLLLAQGIAMKQIQDWLGHSTFNTTADIYSHLDFSSKQDSANAISAALNPLQEEPEEQQGMTMQMM